MEQDPEAFCKMYVTVCGRFCLEAGIVAGYASQIRTKSSHTKLGVQLFLFLLQQFQKILPAHAAKLSHLASDNLFRKVPLGFL